MASKFQNAFVKGRQILNVTLITHESIDLMMVNQGCSASYIFFFWIHLCKLEIGKSYDLVN